MNHAQYPVAVTITQRVKLAPANVINANIGPRANHANDAEQEATVMPHQLMICVVSANAMDMAMKPMELVTFKRVNASVKRIQKG